MIVWLLTLLATFFLFPFSLAQSSVPAPLSSNFDLSSIQLQVSYNGDAFSGFQDGSTVPFSTTSNTPVFALGDASGVNTAITFFIMMVDSTDVSNLALHFLQTDFKASGEKTGIASSSNPVVTYQRPGAFGESGTRQYSFLLFEQQAATFKGLPQTGVKFDIAGFQTANGLTGALAGLGMDVVVAGSISTSTSTSSSGGVQQSSPQARSSSTPSATLVPTTQASSPATTTSTTNPSSLTVATSTLANPATISSLSTLPSPLPPPNPSPSSSSPSSSSITASAINTNPNTNAAALTPASQSPTSTSSPPSSARTSTPTTLDQSVVPISTASKPLTAATTTTSSSSSKTTNPPAQVTISSSASPPRLLSTLRASTTAGLTMIVLGFVLLSYLL